MAKPIPGQPYLMLVTEPMEVARLVQVVRKAVAGGVNLVQLRDRSATVSEVIRTTRALQESLGETPLLINGSTVAARDAHAAGLHLPESGPKIEDLRREMGPDKWIGRSIHTVENAILSAEAGADYLVAGTIFVSRSHPGAEPAGIAFLKTVCKTVSIPVIAIGGITPENAPDCIGAGAAGVAVLSSILHADDPRAAAAQYRAALERP